MKLKFLLSILFVCTFMVNTRAQISKDAIWVGGAIGYSQNKEDYESNPSYKSNSLNINPAIGKVVKDNLVVGINLFYNRSIYENNGLLIENKGNRYGGGIFVRQYMPVAGRFYLFGDASASFQAIDEKSVMRDYNSTTRINTATKGSMGGLGITPGVSFAINRKIQIESALNNLFGISYFKTNTTSANNSYGKKTENFTAGIFTDGKVQFNLGIRFLLNNKGNG